MLIGSYSHSLDDKGRLIMPSEFRKELEEGVVMVRWLEHCVAIFPRQEFSAMVQRFQALPEGNTDKREFARLLLASAYQAVPDRQGRITIPPKLREIAGLDREVEVVGLMDHVEVWERERWRKYERAGEERYEQNAGKLSEFGF